MSHSQQTLRIGGHALTALASGALHWAARATLFVSDLHFGKGASFARKGAFLPPYDTRATLARLAALVEALAPKRVVCLGDSFHTRDCAAALDPADAAALRGLTRRCDWIWIAGNHDPLPPDGLGGTAAAELSLDGLVCRHIARPGGDAAELSGHFHPTASLSVSGRRVTRRCFVADERRAILPAFGAFTGGLNALDPAVAPLFPRGFEAYVLGRRGVHRFASRHLAPPPS